MSEPSFRVTKTDGAGESPAQTRKQMADALKNLPLGKQVLGAIRDDIVVEEPVVKEELTEEELVAKKELKEFLLKNIPVPDLGSKFKPDECRFVLRKKIDKMTWGELRRFWAGKIPDGEVPEEKLDELAWKWRDISP